ncbi:DUF63 family protein [Candidatus Micrarchaeota archaeon]|nr:DUF63 family protein [Candidatus Micrarchaeota archaeon]
MGIFEEFFIAPIIEKTGYNIINTATYAAIALGAVWLLFWAFRRFGVKINNTFFWGVLSFVLFGSSMRVVTDSIDTGVFTGATPLHQLVLDSGIYEYGFVTVSPGIYVLVAAVLLLSICILNYLKRMELLPYIGLALFAFHFILLLPFMEHLAYAIPVLLLAGIPAYIIWRRYGGMGAAVVGGHALDGAATFVILDWFSGNAGRSYFEQHVIPRAVGDLFDTYFTFFLLKVAISAAAVYLVSREDMKDDERTFFLLVVAIVGLAPGIRDVLRMVCGA